MPFCPDFPYNPKYAQQEFTGFPGVFTVCVQRIMMIMKRSSMTKTEFDLKTIIYSAYGIHHRLRSICGNTNQLTRYPSESHRQNMASFLLPLRARLNSLRPSDTYICVGELTTFGSDNGSAPSRRQAVI